MKDSGRLMEDGGRPMAESFHGHLLRRWSQGDADGTWECIWMQYLDRKLQNNDLAKKEVIAGEGGRGDERPGTGSYRLAVARVPGAEARLTLRGTRRGRACASGGRSALGAGPGA